MTGIQKRNSLVYRAGIIILLILILQVALLLANNLYSYHITTENAVAAKRSTMTVAIEQIKKDLQAATSILTELSAEYTKNVIDYQDTDELRKYLASIDMANMLDTKISSNPVVECVFFSNPGNDIYLTRYNSQIYWEQKIGIDDYVKQHDDFSNDAIEENWHVEKIGNVYYLMQVYTLNYVNIGVMVKTSRFIDTIESTASEENSQYVFTDTKGNILDPDPILEDRTSLPNDKEIISRFEKKHFVITLPVSGTPLRLSCIEHRTDIYYGLGVIQYLMIAFGLLAVIVVIISMFFLRRQIIKPVQKLVHATKEVERGNLDYRIGGKMTSLEFETLIKSFNNMIKEIKDLKIVSYEEKLDRQRAELKYLQMQLKPHFYLNAINTISSLSLQGKNEEIRRFILALSEYLRYLFTDNLAMVRVKDEIDHAVDYIKLQQIKFPHMVFYMAEVKKESAEYRMPKLLVQTFVENIFKHAYNGEEMLSIFIKAGEVEIESERFAQIIIEDNGDGFGEGYMTGVTEGEECVGIGNVKKTLALTYGRDDLLTLSNVEEGGARVRIRIPKYRREETV
jgi:two-component system sensor histidine kinase YesM